MCQRLPSSVFRWVAVNRWGRGSRVAAACVAASCNMKVWYQIAKVGKACTQWCVHTAVPAACRTLTVSCCLLRRAGLGFFDFSTVSCGPEHSPVAAAAAGGRRSSRDSPVGVPPLPGCPRVVLRVWCIASPQELSATTAVQQSSCLAACVGGDKQQSLQRPPGGVPCHHVLVF